jgi:NADPH:quinone reductase-like Zn-dependent oxidoreductase
MKAAVLARPGLENLTVRDRPDPRPGRGEVLVRLRAASLNFRDHLVVEGGYGSQQRQSDLVPLSDGAGEVVEVGAEVSQWKPGDAVVGSFFPRWEAGPPDARSFAATLGGTHDGVACELRVFGERELAAMPTHLSFEEAACFPCAGVTAWNALMAAGEAAPGMSVVTQGTGGVSLFALQLASALGHRVIATSSSDAKLAEVRALGATDLVNYSVRPDWHKAVREATRDRGAELVIDVGGEATLAHSVKCTAVGGTVSLIGVLGGAAPALPLALAVIRQIRLQGVTVGSTRMLRELLAFVDLHRLRPKVDRTFTLERIQDAIAYFRTGRHFGKVCVNL